MKLTELTALETAEAVNAGEISARRLVETILDFCRNLQGEKKLFASLAESSALEQADLVDQKIKNGFSLPLAGVPLVAGDDFAYSKGPTSLGSPAFKDYTAPFSAAAVEKLNGAGAVLIGKSAIGDLGLEENGPARSRSAKITGLCRPVLSLESDCSGAARLGAAAEKVYCLRPTPGRVSRFGLHLRCGSFDQPALIAGTLTGLGVAFQAAAGYDQRDVLTSLNREQRAAQTDDSSPIEKNVVAYCPALLELLNPGEAKTLELIRERLAGCGCTTMEVSLDYLEPALRAFYVIALAETSSTLSRFDGIRFGSAAEANNLEELYFNSRRLIFGEEARRRTIFGTYLLSQGNFDHYYLKALKVWNLFRDEFTRIFTRADFLLLPLTGSGVSNGEQADFLQTYEDYRFTAPLAMTGQPVLSLATNGQLVGQAFSDEKLLSLGGLLTEQIEDEDLEEISRGEG